jgi:hypothetical protein
MQSITTIHHNLPLNVSKQIVKSIIGSLNATAIAYARGHLRYNAVENIADRKDADNVPTIDDYNDAQNAVDEANFRNTTVADGMGFEVQMQSGELAENFMRLRNYFAAFLAQHQATQNDVPLSIAETVKFQLTRPAQSNDDMIEALAAAVDIDPEMLKAAQLKMVTDDTADLKTNAGKVITYLETFETYAKDEAGKMVPVCDEDEISIESMFDTLPAHVQYKLMSAAIRAHDKAVQKALMALLRGKLDAAGDSKMLKANRESLVAWLTTFSKVKRVQLDAYLERGGVLPELEDRTIVGAAPIVTSTSEAAPTPQAPTTKGSMRRAPRPEEAAK